MKKSLTKKNKTNQKEQKKEKKNTNGESWTRPPMCKVNALRPGGEYWRLV